MKDMLNDAFYALKNTEISKHYDCNTAFRDKSTGKTQFSVGFKGDFSVTPMQILIVGVAAAALCIGCCVKKKLSK